MSDAQSAGDLAGRNVVVTGANTGIGRATAAALARRGARVVLACRSEEKTRPVLDALRAEVGAEAVHFAPLDLASLDSVARCVEALAAGPAIDVLIANAGLSPQKGQVTADGFEMSFGVNHIGHFALACGLVDRIPRGGRVVVVASAMHYKADGIDFEAVRRPTASLAGTREYAVGKLANVLFAAEAARRWSDRGVHTYALHPGVIASDIWRVLPWPIRPLFKLFLKSTEEGARTSLYCATDPEAGRQSGLYYDDCQVKTPSRAARDEALAAELWRRSAEWTGVGG